MGLSCGISVDSNSPVLGGGAPAPPAWAPTDLGAGLKMWTRPEELTTGTIPSWEDQSGEDNHPVQATEANKLTVEANALDGWKGAKGDGTQTFMVTPYAPSGTIHVFVVGALGTGEMLMDGEDAVANKRYIMYESSLSYTMYMSTALTVDTISLGTYYLFEALFIPSGTSKGRIDAGSYASGSAGIVIGPPTGLVLFARGNKTSGNTSHSVLEYIIHEGEITGDDLTSLNSYIDTRYPTLGI